MGTNVAATDRAVDVGRLLSAWRGPGRGVPRRDGLHGLRGLLAGRFALHRRGWSAALADPAAAIGLAMALVAEGALEGPAADLAFSALLAHAAEGDPAAAVVLGHVRSRLRAAHAGEGGRA